MQRSSGFTLLEVMVAMTITALALGSLFGVIAGNKRLAWRAEAALLHGIEVRSLINSAQLNDEQGEVFTESRKDKLQLVTDEKLKVPERKTEGTTFDLRGYLIKDEHGEVLVKGTYWMRPELPQTPIGATPAQGAQQPFGPAAPNPVGGPQSRNGPPFRPPGQPGNGNPPPGPSGNGNSPFGPAGTSPQGPPGNGPSRFPR